MGINKMGLSLSSKQMKEILKNQKKTSDLDENIKEEPVKPKRTAIDRINDAVIIIEQYPNNDKIYLHKDTLILNFEDIALISNNDLLRTDNRKIYVFKKAWHERVAHLLKNVDLSKWKTKTVPVVIEFLYCTKNAKRYDPDSIISAFKSPLDGLVEAGVLNDDTVEDIPIIIARQEKSTTCPIRDKKINTLTIVISPVNDISRYYSEAFKKITEKASFSS